MAGCGSEVLELDEEPCIRLSAMSEIDKHAYILEDNKLAKMPAGTMSW